MMTNRNIPVPGPQFPSVVPGHWGSFSGWGWGGLHPTSRVQGSGQLRGGRETFGPVLAGQLASWLFSQKKEKTKTQTPKCKKNFPSGTCHPPGFSSFLL